MRMYQAAALIMAMGLGTAVAQTMPPRVPPPGASAGAYGSGGTDYRAQGNVPTTQQHPLETIPETSGPGPNPPSGRTTNPALGTPSPH
jgi:hypothetical protein